jgi:hypothetical protein
MYRERSHSLPHEFIYFLFFLFFKSLLEIKFHYNIMKTSIKQTRGGKWSMKYKKTINCNKPKGFSQKQYCKYGRKKTIKQKSKSKKIK